MDLDSMKYAELQSLAKELGLKANMKTDKLVKAIKEHYQQEKRKGEGDSEGREKEKDANSGQEDGNVSKDRSTEKIKEVFSRPVFVNTSRGRGKGTKRKISDTATPTEGEPSIPPSAAEGDNEAAASCAPLGAKKRKVSSTKDRKTRAAASDQQKPEMKDEAPEHEDTEKPAKVVRAGKIPRYQGNQQKNKQLLKPVTPNFKKLHEAHFNKMESIDSYVQRKTKQMETYRSSVKELKKLSDKTKLQQAEGKTQVKANRASLFSPVPVNKRTAEEKPRRTVLSASKAPNKPARMEDALFRPTVLSTRRMTVRFSEATRDNEYKRSMVKTPARMSSYVTSSTPQKQTSEGTPNNVNNTPFSATKSPGPFVFTGNTSTSTTPGTQKKTKFDLKASLSRPLTYKPHTGKLKPFGDVKENTAADKSLNAVSSHQKNYKQHQVQTRKDRREKLKTDRKQKKENVLGARRGLVMM